MVFSVAQDSYAKNWAESHGFAYVERESGADAAAVSEEAVNEEAAAPEESAVPEEAAPEESAVPEEAAPEESAVPEEAALEESADQSADEATTEDTNADDGGELSEQPAVVTVAGGSCGDAATWTLLSDGTLCISGYGELADFSETESAPWAAWAGQITALEIGPQITVIGAYAFYGLENLKTVAFAENGVLVVISDYSFAYCKQLKEIALPETLAVIGEAAFAQCAALELVELPESVEEIGIRIVEEDETEGQEPPALVDTFAGCPLLQVKAVPDSYAGAYAAEHQIPVIFEEE